MARSKVHAGDLIGQRFGRLIVVAISMSGRSKAGAKILICRCDCGDEVLVVTANLVRGHTKSCGCLGRDRRREAKTTHGMFKSVECRTLIGMRSRCSNSSLKTYKNYGSKGIKVCDRWTGKDGFANFYADMGPRPSGDYTIDRIDSDGDYEPANCRWLTRSENTSRAHKGKRHAIK